MLKTKQRLTVLIFRIFLCILTSLPATAFARNNSASSFSSKEDTIQTELGFKWHKLQHIGQSTQFHIVLPRSHPLPGYGSDIWSYVILQSEHPDFLRQIENYSIVDDTVSNHWLVLDGTFSDIAFQMYQITALDSVPMIDMSLSYPFPAEYPDSVELFLMPGRNIESDNPELIALADSLVAGSSNMAVAAQNIATSKYVSSIPYDQADLDAVKNGTTTFSWADGSVASALETYHAGKAVCSEIARLETALCRAAGIPARTISWVRLHVWTEVWINGFGWQQMDKGKFPHYRQSTLARLSGNDDAVYFDWIPQDTSFFKMTDIKMDKSQSKNFVESIRLIIARPTTMTLPLIYEERPVGLIQIGNNHGLYFSREDTITTLHILKGKGPDCLFEKSWSNSSDFEDSLTIDVPQLHLVLKIESIREWVVTQILEWNSPTGINEKQSGTTQHQFNLSQNYPNPFNLQTTISYQLPICSKVSLKIYDMLGQEVRSLVNENKSAGFHSVVWNGKDDSGQPLSSGSYFYNLRLDNNDSLTKGLLLLK